MGRPQDVTPKAGPLHGARTRGVALGTGSRSSPPPLTADLRPSRAPLAPGRARANLAAHWPRTDRALAPHRWDLGPVDAYERPHPPRGSFAAADDLPTLVA